MNCKGYLPASDGRFPWPCYNLGLYPSYLVRVFASSIVYRLVLSLPAVSLDDSCYTSFIAQTSDGLILIFNF